MRDTKALIDLLILYQTKVETVLASGEAKLRDGNSDALDLGRSRWELARALSPYQYFKHGELFDPLIAHGSLSQVRQARRMKAACLRLGEDFRTYLKTWGSADILDDQANYRQQAIAMLHRIGAHLATERREAMLLLSQGHAAAA